MTRPSVLVAVAGTATGVGKTWLTARILESLRGRGLAVGARKPVQSYAPDDIGATDAGARQFRIQGMVLTSMGRGDKEPIEVGAPDDNVSRFVAREQRFFHEGTPGVAQVDHRDTVGEVVDHICSLSPNRHCHGLKPDQHLTNRDRQVALQAVNLQPVVGSVDGHKKIAIERNSQWANVSRFKERKGFVPTLQRPRPYGQTGDENGERPLESSR